jgi:hypothetical protein
LDAARLGDDVPGPPSAEDIDDGGDPLHAKLDERARRIPAHVRSDEHFGVLDERMVAARRLIDEDVQPCAG